jgi:carboxypeptidase PM20D1
VLDEGGCVVSGVLKGVKPPLALIGVAEKGFCNYGFTVNGEGGHSSMPPSHTALGNAAYLIREIENHPMKPRLTAPVAGMLRNIAGEMGFVVRMAVANIRLFKPLLLRVFTANPVTGAMARTTFAATMAQAGDAPNVLPRKAKFTVNARLLPGDTVESVGAYLAALSGKVLGATVTMTTDAEAEPSAVSPARGELYGKLRSLTGELYPNALVSPYLVMGGTDARKYESVTDHVYRFTPILVTDAEKNTAHNTNESISIENYGRMIHFFRRLIGEFDQADSINQYRSSVR